MATVALQVIRPTAAPAPMPPAATPERIHYLDNLRALAMLLGVFLHGAFAYAAPAQSFWLATDSESSVVIDATIWFIHLFRMSLFFLLAGYFAHLMIERKAIVGFLSNRALRLAVPFVLCYPILLIAMTLVFGFSLSYQTTPSGLMGLIAEAQRKGVVASEGTQWRTMHLWFLYYLIFFSLLAALFVWLPWPRRLWTFGFAANRLGYWALAPLLLVPGVLGAGVPTPGPESFVPTWWPFATYGLFYAAGWHLHGREILLERLQAYTWHLFGLSVLLFIPYYGLMPVLEITTLLEAPPQSFGWQTVLTAVLTAYLSVTLTVWALLVGKQFLSTQSLLLKFIADSSYWVYLIHLPIILLIQTILIPLPWNVWLKLGTTLSLTMLFCIATYVVFVRYTPIGWLLNGRCPFP
jgi:peptidoglycan/LPS O-acetylase OafA/YrhL